MEIDVEQQDCICQHAHSVCRVLARVLLDVPLGKA
jgi:hypothetical protein